MSCKSTVHSLQSAVGLGMGMLLISGCSVYLGVGHTETGDRWEEEINWQGEKMVRGEWSVVSGECDTLFIEEIYGGYRYTKNRTNDWIKLDTVIRVK